MEFKGFMAAESLYLKISASTSHIVFMEKTKLRTLGEGCTICFCVQEVPYFRAGKSYKVAVTPSFTLKTGD